MGTVTGAAGAAFALCAALACSGTQPVAETALEPESLRAAASRIEAFAAARDDVELVEGGLRAAWRTWRWEERESLPMEPVPPRLGGPWWPPLPERTRERVLVPPFEGVVPWRRITAVRVHRWAIGTAIELDVEGEPEPFLLSVEPEEATALAEALDLLRRARFAAAPAAEPVSPE